MLGCLPVLPYSSSVSTSQFEPSNRAYSRSQFCLSLNAMWGLSAPSTVMDTVVPTWWLPWSWTVAFVHVDSPGPLWAYSREYPDMSKYATCRPSVESIASDIALSPPVVIHPPLSSTGLDDQDPFSLTEW